MIVKIYLKKGALTFDIYMPSRNQNWILFCSLYSGICHVLFKFLFAELLTDSNYTSYILI